MPYKDKDKQREYMREYMRGYRQLRKGERICWDCGVSLIEDEGIYCTNCRLSRDYGYAKGVTKYAVAD